MKLRMPRYFSQFRCIGGSCPDTCCRDWEVALDRETAAFYRSVPGPLGDELRAAMVRREDGPCLSLRGGLCPMLDGRGLCRVQLQLGEPRLSRSCRLYPRFAEEYGALQEWCLTMACPEAARLLLADPAPMTLTEAVDDRPVSGCNDLDARLFYQLLAARNAALALVQDRSVPWQLRLARLLAFGRSYQRALDQHRLSRLPAVTERFAAGRFPRCAPGTQPAAARALLQRLQDLEQINDRWQTLLGQALARTPDDGDRRRFAEASAGWAYQYEHLLHYFLYRYFLKAAVDRRLLPRIQLAAAAVLCIRELELARFLDGGLDEAARIDTLHRFSREVEHSEENLNRLLNRCETDPAMSPESLTAAAW